MSSEPKKKPEDAKGSPVKSESPLKDGDDTICHTCTGITVYRKLIHKDGSSAGSSPICFGVPGKAEKRRLPSQEKAVDLNEAWKNQPHHYPQSTSNPNPMISVYYMIGYTQWYNAQVRNGHAPSKKNALLFKFQYKQPQLQDSSSSSSSSKTKTKKDGIKQAGEDVSAEVGGTEENTDLSPPEMGPGGRIRKQSPPTATSSSSSSSSSSSTTSSQPFSLSSLFSRLGLSLGAQADSASKTKTKTKTPADHDGESSHADLDGDGDGERDRERERSRDKVREREKLQRAAQNKEDVDAVVKKINDTVKNVPDAMNKIYDSSSRMTAKLYEQVRATSLTDVSDGLHKTVNFGKKAVGSVEGMVKLLAKKAEDAWEEYSKRR